MVKRWQELSKVEQKEVQQRLAALPDPNKRDEYKSRSNVGFKLKGYVRCELSASEKEEFSSWESGRDVAASMARLVALVDDGYLLKLSPNSSGFQASLCASETNHAWDGYVLVAMARHAARAADLLVFKHDALLHGDWSQAMDDTSEDFLR